MYHFLITVGITRSKAASRTNWFRRCLLHWLPSNTARQQVEKLSLGEDSNYGGRDQASGGMRASTFHRTIPVAKPDNQISGAFCISSIYYPRCQNSFVQESARRPVRVVAADA